MQSGEKSNKCSQCDYVCSQAGDLNTHFKTNSGEKPKKCNHCNFALSEAGNLRRHLKKHIGEKTTNANSGTLDPHRQVI